MIKEGDHILDLGCGNGNYTKLFFDKVKKDGIIYGIDKNKDLIFDAKIKYSNLSHNINFEVADYDVIDNVGLSFDWVFSIYSIYYTADSLNLIMKLKSVMSRTGKFVVIGPAHKNAVTLELNRSKLTAFLCAGPITTNFPVRLITLFNFIIRFSESAV
jgi:ubiquinone/menaquinone biosynthesis C-methylase UbiE